MTKTSLSLDPTELVELIEFDLQLRQPNTDPWWEVVVGNISSEQLIEERNKYEDEDELRYKARLFAPPSQEESRRTIETLGFARQGEGERRERTQVAEIRPVRRTWVWSAAIGAVAATAAAIVIVWSPPPQAHESRNRMPTYEVVWLNQSSGSTRAVGAPQPPGEMDCARYREDGRLVAHFRPSRVFEEDVQVAVLARRSGKNHLALPIQPTLSTMGVVTIDQPAAELGLTAGRWVMTVFISTGENLPSSEVLSELNFDERTDIAVAHTTVCIAD